MRSVIMLTAAAGLAAAGVLAAKAQDMSKKQAEAHVDHRQATIRSGMAGVTLLKMQGGLIDRANVPGLFNYWATGARLSVSAFEPDTRGTGVETDAKDAVWESWDDFSERMDDYASDVERLAALAQAGDTDEALAGLDGMFKKHCRGCHNEYRKD